MNLTQKVNQVVGKLKGMYFESSELSKAMELYGREELEKTSEKLSAHLNKHKTDALAMLYLANIYFDIGRYNEAAAFYEKAISLQPDFSTAYLNLAALCRERGEFEKAEQNCKKVLELNSELPQAYVSLSRIEFARNRNGTGLEYAKKAYEYGGGDMSVAANLCLAYHYNKMKEDRDKLLEQLKQKNYPYLAALQSVFERKIK